ncbi:DUF6531 domain-containing protein [Streptomyces kronopolitis]
MLPGWADELLDLIGVSWPNVDEDDYREMANAMREFADDIDEGANQAHTAIQSLVGSAGGSLAVEALNSHWGKINGQHLKGLADCGRMAGTAMDGVAVLIEGAKVAALVQLGILAAEVIAAQAAAPFTLGLSEIGALGATQATRMIVKRLFKEVCQQVAEQVISIALTPVEEALGAMVGDLVVQLGANALGVQDGVDLGHTAKAGKEGFNQGVKDAKGAAKSAADNPMELLSAGGHRGGGGGLGGGGGAGGSGGFNFDKDEHDRTVTSLESAGSTFRNKAGGKIGRAKSLHGRTRGKDFIADAANTMLDKVIEGIEDGVKKTAKHLDDNMTRGIKQMAKNHHDNDKGLADHFKGLGRNDKKEPKTPGLGGGNTPGRKSGTGRKNGARQQADKDPHGNSRTQDSVCSNGTDPIDLATGKMYLPQVDVNLPGVLPLVFSRRVESGYRAGRWFGESWSSTVDQRLEIDTKGVVFIHEDGLLLDYPHPTEARSVFPHAGPRWPLVREESGTYTISDPATGRSWHFVSQDNDSALLEEISDRNGNWISFGYDDSGTPTDITHSGGYHLKFTTDNSRITALHLAGAAPDGTDQLLRVFGYTDGNLTSVTNSSGLPLRFDYDARNRVTSWIDTNGSRYEYVYDEQDRCVAEGGEAGHMSLRFSYEGEDPETGLRVTKTTTGSGRTRRFLSNRAHQVVAEIDVTGAVTHSERDQYNRPLSTTDALGHTTQFTYDEAGNLLTAVRPDGLASTSIYNDLNLPTQITSPDGATWQQEYDARGNRLSITDPSGATTRYSYNNLGHLATITNALDHTALVECNPAGQPVAVTSPDGAVTQYVRDTFGRVASITDPLGATTLLYWTVEGQCSARIHPDGSSETWEYDGEGNCVTHVDTAGGTTRFQYSHFDLMTARSGPDGRRYAFEYNEDLQLTKVTDPQGLEWSYEYDVAGRLTSETDFDGRVLAYTYDAAGRLTGRTNALGETITYTRNAVGQVVEQDAGGQVTTYRRDGAGRLLHASGPDSTLSLTLDALGRVMSETVNGRTLISTRDAVGRRIHRRTPAGTESSWSYDPSGLRSSMTASGHHISFGYDDAGRETARTLGENVTLSHVWDVTGRLESQSLTTETNTVQHRTYTYGTDGNLTGIDDLLNGSRRFDLDSSGRVTAVHAHNWTEKYAYDSSGNQTGAEWPGKHPGSEACGSRAYLGTRLQQAGNVRYEYDAQGRIVLRQKKRLSRKPDTWHYTWDAEDRLTSATTPDGTLWRYRYDPCGRRTSKQRIGDDGTVREQIDFVWDGTQVVEQTTSHAVAPHSVTLTWDYDGHHPITQIERKTSKDASQREIDQRFFAIVTDLVGTPTELLNESGEIAWRSRSTLWGSTTWTTKSAAYTPLRFPGQYFDAETGFHYNFQRYYDPETARYATPDPLGLAPAPNPATYVHNPHMWSDPLGLAPECTVTVYRKQDTSIPETMRLSVDEHGNVSLSGNGALYLNMTGDISHTEGFKGNQIVAFDVPKRFVDEIDRDSLPQRKPSWWEGSNRDWNRALKVAPDQSDGPGLFGIPDNTKHGKNYFDALMNSIVPGSGRVINAS